MLTGQRHKTARCTTHGHVYCLQSENRRRCQNMIRKLMSSTLWVLYDNPRCCEVFSPFVFARKFVLVRNDTNIRTCLCGYGFPRSSQIADWNVNTRTHIFRHMIIMLDIWLIWKMQFIKYTWKQTSMHQLACTHRSLAVRQRDFWSRARRYCMSSVQHRTFDAASNDGPSCTAAERKTLPCVHLPTDRTRRLYSLEKQTDSAHLVSTMRTYYYEYYGILHNRISLWLA